MKARHALASVAAGAFFLSMPVHAALVQLDFTAELRWGGVTGPYTQQGKADFIQANTTGVTQAPFQASGRLTIDTGAPPTITFGPASGYWSSEAFAQVDFGIGGSTFSWLNAPGVSNTNYGLTLMNADGSADTVRTGSLTGPTVGGIDSLYFAQILPQSVNLNGTNVALGSLVFEISAPGLITSNLLPDQAFDWGSLAFGQPGDSEDNSLLIQMLAYSGSNPKDPGAHLLAQNASGRFTSFRLAGSTPPGTGGSSVPEPGSMLLSGLALATLALLKRRQPGHMPG